ncbi:unnamed protein product [Protopolystoma xenopodis]|uniref:Uncharacterized protein n=1 Tax=Protopolystoma xenopodis TaxID=117903 RepID=A0A448WHF7_9PLAT|nr:unnamed protein product [Protopolystoma xenopodis]
MRNESVDYSLLSDPILKTGKIQESKETITDPQPRRPELMNFPPKTVNDPYTNRERKLSDSTTYENSSIRSERQYSPVSQQFHSLARHGNLGKRSRHNNGLLEKPLHQIPVWSHAGQISPNEPESMHPSISYHSRYCERSPEAWHSADVMQEAWHKREPKFLSDSIFYPTLKNRTTKAHLFNAPIRSRKLSEPEASDFPRPNLTKVPFDSPFESPYMHLRYHGQPGVLLPNERHDLQFCKPTTYARVNQGSTDQITPLKGKSQSLSSTTSLSHPTCQDQTRTSNITSGESAVRRQYMSHKEPAILEDLQTPPQELYQSLEDAALLSHERPSHSHLTHKTYLPQRQPRRQHSYNLPRRQYPSKDLQNTSLSHSGQQSCILEIPDTEPISPHSLLRNSRFPDERISMDENTDSAIFLVSDHKYEYPDSDSLIPGVGLARQPHACPKVGQPDGYPYQSVDQAISHATYVPPLFYSDPPDIRPSEPIQTKHPSTWNQCSAEIYAHSLKDQAFAEVGPGKWIYLSETPIPVTRHPISRQPTNRHSSVDSGTRNRCKTNKLAKAPELPKQIYTHLGCLYSEQLVQSSDEMTAACWPNFQESSGSEPFVENVPGFTFNRGHATSWPFGNSRRSRKLNMSHIRLQLPPPNSRYFQKGSSSLPRPRLFVSTSRSISPSSSVWPSPPISPSPLVSPSTPPLNDRKFNTWGNGIYSEHGSWSQTDNPTNSRLPHICPNSPTRESIHRNNCSRKTKEADAVQETQTADIIEPTSSPGTTLRNITFGNAGNGTRTGLLRKLKLDYPGDHKSAKRLSRVDVKMKAESKMEVERVPKSNNSASGQENIPVRSDVKLGIKRGRTNHIAMP